MTEAAVAVAPNELVLGRYRPLEPLGSGGSGSVWLARDEPTGVEVALKIVPREGKSASRAEREASAAARLRHAGCQRAYALARDSRHVYIAYEYIPGKTLRQALRDGELDDAAALEAAAQICEALAHAHRHGIVHRDVKPSNVLLAEGEEIWIKLLDFGLARMEGEETLTAAGDVPG
ncbi:MAG TPA: protein kinase, partial [Gaiellaceae bacterium]